MWVFIPGGVVSVVAHRDKPKHVLVRARRQEDLNRFFLDQQSPSVTESLTEHTPANDYAYRVVEKRTVVAHLTAQHINAIDYPNFKAHPLNGGDRAAMLHDVWATVHDWADPGRRLNEPFDLEEWEDSTDVRTPR
jgi:hypothetical protein